MKVRRFMAGGSLAEDQTQELYVPPQNRCRSIPLGMTPQHTTETYFKLEGLRTTDPDGLPNRSSHAVCEIALADKAPAGCDCGALVV